MPYNTSTNTYKDLIDHLVDFLGSSGQKAELRDARRAIQTAYRDLANSHKWSYYMSRGRIVTVAPQTTGTVTYDHTGGAYERMLTLSGGTWPSWVENGTVLINNIPYESDSNPTTNIVTLSANANPGADITAASSYTLYRDTYPLPADFQSADEFINLNNALEMRYVRPGDWLMQQRHHVSTSQPCIYTFMNDPNYLGVMAVRFFPAPDQICNFDFIYQRMPRPILIEEYSTGTVSVQAGFDTVTGSGTQFNSRMVGSVIRVTESSVNLPTGLAGSNPYLYERVITAVSSSTSMTVDDVYPESISGVKFVISDPADIDEQTMLTALLRGCEHQVARSRSLKERSEIAMAYREALIQAKEADSRSFQRRWAGMYNKYSYRLANMPIDFTSS